MMIPLTPDVQARAIVCGADHRRANGTPGPARGKPQTCGPSNLSAQPRSRLETGVQTPPTALNQTHSTTAPSRALRRSQSSYNLSSAAAQASGAGTHAQPTLQRSRSMVALSQARAPQQRIEEDEREREREAREAARAALPSRMRCMRHIIGFRKYNKLPEVRKKIIDACEMIETMARSQHGAYQLALDQVDASLAALAAAEHNFYKETDRVRQYEEKLDELNYLKDNIELCVKESMTYMKGKYYTEFLPLVGSRHSMVEERRWRDYKEIRIFVNQLKANLADSQESDEQSHSVPSQATIAQEIREARALCAQPREWRGLQPLFEAEDQLVALQGHLDKIQRFESQLKTTLLRYQAATNTLINVNREVNATTRILKAKAELAAGTVDREGRNLDEEERMLREFILAARQADDDGARWPAKSPGSPQSSLPPLSSTTPPTPLSSPPVWCNTWTPHTKVLPKHAEFKPAEFRSAEFGPAEFKRV